jgi:hypothetical protein
MTKLGESKDKNLNLHLCKILSKHDEDENSC